jgi:N-methylhydantoinase A
LRLPLPPRRQFSSREWPGAKVVGHNPQSFGSSPDMFLKGMAKLVIGIDTGGTFTDCVYRSGGKLEVLKLRSTPEDPGRAILEAIATIASQTGADQLEIRHGTTVATNALLERKGARVAFVSTEGFEDTLAIGRQARPDLYDWNTRRPEPLALRELCFGVKERIGPDGTVVCALDKKSLGDLSKKIKASGAESIAVSLLFSFANSENERTVAGALQSLHLPMSLSHQVLPEFREYERAATVTLNAYLAPRMSSYIGLLERSLTRRGARLSIMQSSGGILSAQAAAREPVRTILSGPAGGVAGALSVARRVGIDRVLSFDMGGTSTDVALLDTTREPPVTIEGQVSGLPVRVPMLDIHTAGAGGGSLAWMDLAGTLQVGPQSAGADPGPACYGRGKGATVTDANLLLGRLHPDHFLGGAMRLDPERAHAALDRVCAGGAFASLEALAGGMVRVANARMESALRQVSVERGHNPRSFALLAFGGAGPLHACALASSLGIGKVLIPAAPGALSALGILDADLRREFSRTVMLKPGSPRIRKVFAELEAEARITFRSEGVNPTLTRAADLRYDGQGFELRVDWSGNVIARFHAMHERSYGYADPARSVEVVTLRVQAVARTPRPRQTAAPITRSNGGHARIGPRQIFEDGRWCRGALYDRSLLHAGDRISGPAVIVELSATTYLPSGWTAIVDGFSNLVLTHKLSPMQKGCR